MTDIFISYASVDRDKVGALARALEKEGLSIWWDRALLPGDSYEDEIEKAISAAKAILVVWTPASVVSMWVRSEADDGRVSGRLTPIVLEICRVPKPFDRIHTADLTRWRGDRGNDGFPELVEALSARVEGRRTRPVRWRRRITFTAIASLVVGGVTFASALTGLADFAARQPRIASFVEKTNDRLTAADGPVLGSQDEFKNALSHLARSSDLRTQKALTILENGTPQEALLALAQIATDQTIAADDQMDRAASLWRQIGLIQFNMNPAAALEALKRAQRLAPDDAPTLTAIGVLLQREGDIAEAGEFYARVLAQGGLSVQDEARARQVVGHLRLEQGDLEEAKLQFDKAMRAAESINDDMLISDLMIDNGRIATETFDLELARQLFVEAADFANSIEYDRSYLFARLNLAEAEILSGQLEQAEEVLHSALSDAAAQNDLVATTYLSLTRAKLLMHQGDLERALQMATAAIDGSKTASLRSAVLQGYLLRAELLVRLNSKAEARVDANASLEGWKKLGAEGSALLATAALNAATDPITPDACRDLQQMAENARTGYLRSEIIRLGNLVSCNGVNPVTD